MQSEIKSKKQGANETIVNSENGLFEPEPTLSADGKPISESSTP